MLRLNDYENAIFENWLEIYKRSATSKLILELLTESSKDTKEITTAITKKTGGSWSVDDKSIHRTMRRLEKLDLVCSEKLSVKGTGLKKKLYSVTDHGKNIAAAMAEV